MRCTCLRWNAGTICIRCYVTPVKAPLYDGSQKRSGNRCFQRIKQLYPRCTPAAFIHERKERHTWCLWAVVIQSDSGRSRMSGMGPNRVVKWVRGLEGPEGRWDFRGGSSDPCRSWWRGVRCKFPPTFSCILDNRNRNGTLSAEDKTQLYVIGLRTMYDISCWPRSACPGWWRGHPAPNPPMQLSC